MSTIVLKVTQKEKDLVESLLWVLDLLPKKCGMSSSPNRLFIYNNDKDKTLELEVEDS